MQILLNAHVIFDPNSVIYFDKNYKIRCILNLFTSRYYNAHLRFIESEVSNKILLGLEFLKHIIFNPFLMAHNLTSME